MKKITIIAILTSMLFSTFLKADEIQIVVVKKPSALEEGTQKDLSPEQIAELLPWAKDSKSMLSDLLENIQGLGMADKVNRMVDGIQQVVGASAPKNSELFMRYILNRALVLNDMLEKEVDADTVGAVDVKSRVLVLSIKMAIKYYDIDSAKLADQKVVSPFASFGIEYFTFLKELNKSIFDASAQYKIERTSLEWLQWDLYRDLNNTTYASTIIKINNALRIFPATKISDSQSLSYIKQVRKVSEGLNLNDTQKNHQNFENSNSGIDEKSPQAYRYGDITIEDRVIDRQGNVGTVKNIFSNGAAKVLFDGYTIILDRQVAELSKEVEGMEGPNKTNYLVRGTRVIDHQGIVGTVKNIFANQVVKVLFDGYATNLDRNYSQLSMEIEGMADHRGLNSVGRGTRVIDRQGNVGTVKNIFANQVVKVLFDGYNVNLNRKYSDLSIEILGIEKLKRGTRVIDRQGIVGTVKNIFANEVIKVLFDGYAITLDRKYSDLSIKL